MKRSVRILSDGGPYDVKVLNVETNEIVPEVRAVVWRAVAGQIPVAEIEVTLAGIDTTVVNPRIRVGSHILTMEQWERVQAFIRTLANEES